MPARLPKKATQKTVNLADARKKALAKLEASGSPQKGLALIQLLVPKNEHPDRVRAQQRAREESFVAGLLERERAVHRQLHDLEIDGDIACTGVDCSGYAVTVAHAVFLEELERLEKQQIASASTLSPLALPPQSRAEAIVALRERYEMTFREIVSLMKPKLDQMPMKLVLSDEAKLREAQSAQDRGARKASLNASDSKATTSKS